LLHLASKDYAAAVKDATAPGTADSRIRALALGAEWAEQPGAFLEPAEKIAHDSIGKNDVNFAVSPQAMLRLASIAARHGEIDKANNFAKAINDIPLRTYAQAEILRQSLLADRKRVANAEEAAIPAELNPKDYLLGHAWGRYHLARHNGFNDDKLGRQYGDSWPKSLVAPFGVAGAMLGAQDRKVNP
jgi:hypothetical protein